MFPTSTNESPNTYSAGAAAEALHTLILNVIKTQTNTVIIIRPPLLMKVVMAVIYVCFLVHTFGICIDDGFIKGSRDAQVNDRIQWFHYYVIPSMFAVR